MVNEQNSSNVNQDSARKANSDSSSCLTLKMSHARRWHWMCVSTDCDSGGHWLRRLVRLPYFPYLVQGCVILISMIVTFGLVRLFWL
jgi:hypothetical protein